jgi:hypothetical protein
VKKEAEKLLKYKYLLIEIQRLWDIKEKMIPVVTGATESLSRSFHKYLDDISGKHSSVEI